MQIITFESEVYQDIINKLEDINAKVSEKKDTQPLSEKWLDNQDVCQLLHLSKRTLQHYRDDGILSFSQFGSKIYYRASDVEEHLNKHYKPAFNKRS